MESARPRKWAGAELNRRHRDFQSRALPTELPTRDSPDYTTAPGTFNLTEPHRMSSRTVKLFDPSTLQIKKRQRRPHANTISDLLILQSLRQGSTSQGIGREYFAVLCKTQSLPDPSNAQRRTGRTSPPRTRRGVRPARSHCVAKLRETTELTRYYDTNCVCDAAGPTRPGPESTSSPVRERIPGGHRC